MDSEDDQVGESRPPLPLAEHAALTPLHRRSIRAAATAGRRLTNEPELLSAPELDPNVFLISSDTNSHNTIRKTKHDVKRFVMYIEEQFGEQLPLQTLAAESLCRYLKHYFENTKKFDGSQYEPDTLRSFLLSIERYLKSKNYQYNLMESALFQSCRQVIATKREEWKKLGVNHPARQPSAPFTLLNFHSLTFFDRSKPDGLLLEIYVHVLKLCQSTLSQLLWGEISLVDEQYLVCNQQKLDNQTVRLCATPLHPSTCPVQAYRHYATQRPPQCNTAQSPFFLIPRSTNAHHIWYKTSAAGKHLEQILQRAIQHLTLFKQSPIAPPLEQSYCTLSGQPNESSSSSSARFLPAAKRIKPLNLSLASTLDDDSGTASGSPTNSLSNEVLSTSAAAASSSLPVWDESITEILLAVAKQQDTRTTKINALRSFLEEKLGFVEFLCLYRGFKSEPKLTFQGTPWEHYQRFLPVLFTLLTLDNTAV